MLRIVSLVVLSAVVSAPARADIDYWRLRGFPGFVRDVAVDPTDANVLWAARSNIGTSYGDFGAPAGNGIAQSIDGGATWTAHNSGLTNLYAMAVAIDPSNTSIIYLGTAGGGVFRTSDAGQSWAPRNVGLGSLDVYSVAIDPSSPSTVYAGTNGGGLYRSTNAGLSWTATSGMGGGIIVWQVAFDPAAPSTLYAATNAGVRKSVDGGATWNGTATMTSHEARGALRTVADTRAVVVDAAGSGTVWAGLWDGAGVFTSTNGGASWNQTSTGLLSRYGNWRFVNRLVQDPTKPQVLYTTTSRETYRSIDGGATWAIFDAGLSRGESFALTTSSPGGAFIATVLGEFHHLATRASGVDHFRCLKAKGRGFAHHTVSVSDRFGTSSVTVLKPYRFCTPTSVSGEPIVDATTHLVCYKVQGGAVAPIDVPFLTQRLDGYRAYTVNRDDTLCVPASADGVPSAQPRDAYRCLAGPHYASEPLDLLLSDAFGLQPVRDNRTDRLCSPTDVDGAGRIEPDVELRCDKVMGPKPAPATSDVTVTDPFGTLQLKLGRTDSHCVQALNSRN